MVTREGMETALDVAAADYLFPRFSPDGNWVAYVSDISGRSTDRAFRDHGQVLRCATTACSTTDQRPGLRLISSQ